MKDKYGRPLRKCKCGKYCHGKTCKECYFKKKGTPLSAYYSRRKRDGIGTTEGLHTTRTI